jgi:predicted transcriptional regulator
MLQTTSVQSRRNVQVRLDADLATWLETEARRRVVSKAFIIERALEDFRERDTAA